MRRSFCLWADISAAAIARIFFALTSCPVRRGLSAQNLVVNRRNDWIGRPVLSQRAPCAAGLRYGRTPFSRTGCGAAAIYNALTLAGLSVSLASILYQLERRRCVSCGGSMGTHPYTVGKVLALYPVQVRRLGTLQALETAAKTGDTAVLAVWNDRRRPWRGAHFFAVQRTNGGFAAYNREAAPANGALSDILGRGRLITAYLIRPFS